MRNIILYDGSCGFCSFWVQWVLKRDKNNKFYFASLQGEKGQKFLKDNNFNDEIFDTIYLIRNEEYFVKMNAVIEIGNELGGAYKGLKFFKILPENLANIIYDFIAKNRYKFSSKYCILPTTSERNKFLDY